MDPYSNFVQRFRLILPFLMFWFGAGIALAWWNPYPRLMLTVALGISLGILLLGPYAAAALYMLRLQDIWQGHLRWRYCPAGNGDGTRRHSGGVGIEDDSRRPARPLDGVAFPADHRPGGPGRLLQSGIRHRFVPLPRRASRLKLCPPR